MKFYENPDHLKASQDQFEKDIQEFIDGKMNPIKFKALRVAHGVYEQRQRETYMIRIRCAAGGITPKQLKKCAEVARKYGSNEVHFTTRQEVQVHDVLIENVMNVIRELLTVGLSTRGGGGNTIRNILTTPISGIDPEEVFDVDPYAVALTTRMIFEPDSWNLPRKFKINFSNSSKDDSYTQATCLGFVAKEKNGAQGFEVYTAGGMGAKPMLGHKLFDFLPADKVYHVTKAMKVMFDKHGNRRSKFSNRIKFLYKKLSKDEFERLFFEEYDAIKDDESLNLVLPELPNEGIDPGIPVQAVDSPDFDQFKKRYVFDQKQEGLVGVKLPLRLGDLLSDDADILCDFLDQFGDNVIRCDRAQNMRLRNIPKQYLGNLFNVIRSMKQELSDIPAMLGNMINCTGAQTCKLGICLPRGLSDVIREKLIAMDLNLDAIPDFKINMSGCPNTCGMHHVADLGFFGKIGRKSGNMYPAYNVLAGAKSGAGKVEYAKKEGEIPVKHVPDFVADFLSDYIETKEDFDSYADYLDAEGRDLIHELCEKYKEIPEFEDNKEFYIDFGAKNPLNLDEMGSAECSAGLFDMINVDKKEIEDIRKNLADSSEKQTELKKIMHHSTRMLLVTRGLDARSEEQAYELFSKHFITTGLVSESFMALVDTAKDSTGDLDETKVLALSDEVLALYKTMDDSLRFKSSTGEVIKEKPTTSTATVQILEKDFRGVACPMNFVKTKLALDTIQSSDMLQIILDDGEPIQNVPNSVKLEGHLILDQSKQDDGTWKVLIKKK